MRRFVVLSVLCASWLVGCGDPYVAARDGGGGGGDDGGVTPDGATPLEDGGKTDTGTGADTKPAEDVGSPGDPCSTPGKSESAKCGKCGSQVRVCNSDKTWSEWSSCSGEGVCTAYETATEACSGGGTRSRSCTSSCTWGSWGSCEGAPPPCGTLGKTETQTCGKCGSQLRTCGATGWSAWGACGAEGECTSGATESAACGTGGTKTRTCGSTCTWGAYGTCVGGTPTTGCASGSPRQTFSSSSFSGMWGCSGTSTWSGASTLCASGYHVCSATEFSSRRGSTIPSHHYWVSDYLNGSGSEGACKASKSTASGNFCPTDAPMRVCGSTKYDASGNFCTWVACGYESTSSSLYYGGCNDDGSSHGLQAGALCCN
ncbi:MAG: hypothetical protein JNL79_38110 [Myxococcales bacterium]|nr:hypothetical protein [Myxococcales bacterium]